jgi:hypothetical protein
MRRLVLVVACLLVPGGSACGYGCQAPYTVAIPIDGPTAALILDAQGHPTAAGCSAVCTGRGTLTDGTYVDGGSIPQHGIGGSVTGCEVIGGTALAVACHYQICGG